MVDLVAVVIIGGLTAFGSSVKWLFQLIVANPPFN
jgi:Flp pilus assembly pilin Flp